MTFDFASVIIFLSLAQGLFTGISLFLLKSRNSSANYLLLGVILALAWYQLEFLMVRNTIDIGFRLFYGTRFGSWLLLGPLIYAYTQVYLSGRLATWRKLSFHLLPFLILAIFIPLLDSSVTTNRAVTYGMLTVFDDWNREEITPLRYAYGSIFYIQFLHVLMYSVLSLTYINRYQQKLKSQYSNLRQVAIRFQRWFHWFLILIIVPISGFILYQFITHEYRLHMDYLYVIPLSVASYFLLFQAIKYPNVIFNLSVTEQTYGVKYSKSSLSATASAEILKALTGQLKQKRLYRNSELRLAELAETTGHSANHLSQAINENTDYHFFDFINHHRIEDAKELITNNPKRPLIQIAMEVGFNNKNSFNSAFKKHTGMTPSAFRANVNG